MTAVDIVFKLMQVYQPGGGAERTGLLRNLSDQKVGTTPMEVLSTVRQWRRWLMRTEELGVALPDSLVLTGVLHRMADVVSKGHSQVAYGISTVRQELKLDSRPTVSNVKLYAELIQAEAEELALTNAVKGGF